MNGLDPNFLPGLILGIGLFIIILFIRIFIIYNRYGFKHPKEIVDEDIPIDELRYCPNCGRKITIELITCPYCGKKFEDV